MSSSEWYFIIISLGSMFMGACRSETWTSHLILVSSSIDSPLHLDYQFRSLTNSNILFTDDGSGTIKENLIDELDYVLVPSESWDLLVQWYGTVDQNTAIPRQVSCSSALSWLLMLGFTVCVRVHVHVGMCSIFYHQMILYSVLSWTILSFPDHWLAAA
jgi:hypothetical protein